MILNFPSGFYRSQLPPAPGNVGNIAYTISNNAPARGSLFLLKIDANLARISKPFVSSVPQGIIESGILKSSRSLSIVSTPPRPIGSTIEFTDAYRDINVSSSPLNQRTEFPRFSDPETVPINSKLYDAYVDYQNQLLNISNTLITKQTEIENLERLVNAARSSLDATTEALKIFPNDSALIQAKLALDTKMITSNTQINVLRDEVVALNTTKTLISDSIRKISKALL